MTGFEVVKRQEMQQSQKENIRGRNVQISFNSWGHLCVRLVGTPSLTQDPANPPTEAETLIVFDKCSSAEIVRFCQSDLRDSRQQTLPPF
jgi:hypothetical protein